MSNVSGCKREKNILNENSDKEIIVLLKRWLENRNNNKKFSEYFESLLCNNVIIVDAGEIGRILYEEIKDSDINILCFYDRNAEGLREIDGIPVYPFSQLQDMPNADMVIVSPVYNYDVLLDLIMKIRPQIRSVCLNEAVFEL